MIATTAPPFETPGASPLRLVAAGPELWRVVRDGGHILGHVQRIVDGTDTRYRALRYRPAGRSFRTVGDFWSAADAVDCLRFGG
ncbi:hypothetical protein H9651_02835 [Microbacterium sp. Sa4CUA7]|uniref:DNA mismatch repair protein n=1 Tax=Microbacterium pullorum TaxID=2762236 RepID=A0ABR8RZC2_9MICO|nr:hypothetical protein [Microbacterium pullorum]MBD7956568.1 hypothetical protein [Microbacterium pullorum]